MSTKRAPAPKRVADLHPPGVKPRGVKRQREMPQIAEVMAAFLREGVGYRVASTKAGLAWSTAQKWIAKGEEDLADEVDSEFARFAAVVLDAAGDGVKILLDTMSAAGERDWRCHAWVLKHLWPEFVRPAEEAQQVDPAKVRLALRDALGIPAEEGER